MKYIRESSEPEVVLNFLDCELDSARFSAELKSVMDKYSADESLIHNADLSSSDENLLRANILGDFRGWGQDRELFERFPNVERWYVSEFECGDIERLHYINYDYWNILSEPDNTPMSAAKNIRGGLIVYDVPNDPSIKGAELLNSGVKFKPMILLTSDNKDYNIVKDYIIVEGHSRATAYALAKPECIVGQQCFIGTCSEDELRYWNGR